MFLALGIGADLRLSTQERHSTMFCSSKSTQTVPHHARDRGPPFLPRQADKVVGGGGANAEALSLTQDVTQLSFAHQNQRKLCHIMPGTVARLRQEDEAVGKALTLFPYVSRTVDAHALPFHHDEMSSNRLTFLTTIGQALIVIH